MFRVQEHWSHAVTYLAISEYGLCSALFAISDLCSRKRATHTEKLMLVTSCFNFKLSKCVGVFG